MSLTLIWFLELPNPGEKRTREAWEAFMELERLPVDIGETAI